MRVKTLASNIEFMENQTEKKFYSRSELSEFKQIINKKLDEARAEHKQLASSLKEFGGNSADSINFTEYGTESREKEQVEMLMARQGKFIDKLEKALIRIENGSYGICRISGEIIPKERLRVVPHATTTVAAKMKQSDKAQRR